MHKANSVSNRKKKPGINMKITAVFFYKYEINDSLKFFIII